METIEKYQEFHNNYRTKLSESTNLNLHKKCRCLLKLMKNVFAMSLLYFCYFCCCYDVMNIFKNMSYYKLIWRSQCNENYFNNVKINTKKNYSFPHSNTKTRLIFNTDCYGMSNKKFNQYYFLILLIFLTSSIWIWEFSKSASSVALKRYNESYNL